MAKEIMVEERKEVELVQALNENGNLVEVPIEETWVCDCCGTRYLAGFNHGLVRDGEQFCKDCIVEAYDNIGNIVICLPEETWVCDYCGERYANSVDHYDYCGNPICSDCAEDKFYECADCGELVPQDDARYIEDRDYFICEDCWDGGDYFYCEGCNCYYSMNRLGGEDEDGYYLCDRCYAGNYIHSYHDDRDIEVKSRTRLAIGELPIMRKYGRNNMKDITPYFGIEVETEGGRKNAKIVFDMLGDDDWCVERDGSLDDGFEIISSPMSYAKWLEEYPKVDKCFKELQANGQTSHNTTTCGLHIHVSRKAFANEEAIRRFVCLVNGFYRPVTRLARRDYSSYIRYNDNIGLKPYRCGLPDDHYDVVNVRRNTVEVRAFKGTLKFDTVMASIELLKNMLEFANKDCGATRIVFHELLKGDFLTAYANERDIWSYGADYVMDFSKWNMNDLKRILIKKKNAKELIKRINNAIRNGKYEELY